MANEKKDDLQMEAFSSGGNACVLLKVTRDGVQRVVRVGTDTGDDEIVIHQKLHALLPNHVPEMIESNTYEDELPAHILTPMKGLSGCKKKLNEWEDEQIVKYRVTEMSYANQGTLYQSSRKTNIAFLADIAFQMICTLYVAQAEFGFMHNDLSARNIVMHKREESKITDVMMIDFDFANFNSSETAYVTMGSRYLLPPEILGGITEADKRQYRSIGTVDMWALGIVLLGCLYGNTELVMTNQARKNSDEDMCNRIHWLLSALGHKRSQEQLTDEAEVDMGDYISLIETMKREEPATYEFFARILHPSPRQRVFGGWVCDYFKMDFFKKLVPYVDEYLKSEVIPKFARHNKKKKNAEGYVNIFATAKKTANG
jgi:serine/threonine protein kinase